MVTEKNGLLLKFKLSKLASPKPHVLCLQAQTDDHGRILNTHNEIFQFFQNQL